MKMKKISALLLSGLLLCSTVACGSKSPAATTNTLPTMATVAQREYTAQEVADLFNQAVDSVAQAKSYHMKGSVNSTAAMDDAIATVITSVNCDYQDGNGQPVMLMQSVVNSGGSQTEHVTYYADGKYYFEVESLGLKYYTETNDYTDFHAQHYLKQVQAKQLSDIEVSDAADGSRTIQFGVPYGEYNSEALKGWLGAFTDVETDRRLLTVKAQIGADGKISDFYMSFATNVAFGTSTIDQTLILSLSLSGYDATTVVAPSDLDAYENWNEESSGGGEDIGELSPEDVN